MDSFPLFHDALAGLDAQAERFATIDARTGNISPAWHGMSARETHCPELFELLNIEEMRAKVCDFGGLPITDPGWTPDACEAAFDLASARARSAKLAEVKVSLVAAGVDPDAYAALMEA